jgi:hypothetical protein
VARVQRQVGWSAAAVLMEVEVRMDSNAGTAGWLTHPQFPSQATDRSKTAWKADWGVRGSLWSIHWPI